MKIKNSKSLREMVDVLANIHELEESDIIHILESFVFPKAIRQNYTKDTEISTHINRNTFEIEAHKVFTIVEDDVEDFVADSQIKISEAPKGLKVGDTTKTLITDWDIEKRNCIIVAKQVLNSEINKLKKSIIRENALQLEDRLVNVVVKKFDLKRKVYFVEFNRDFTGIIPFSNLASNQEKLHVNDKYLALLTEEEDPRFQEQVIFTRKGEDFIQSIFEKEIPEIHDELIEVKNFFMTEDKKIFVSVFSNDKNIDPVGTFVGVRGNRVNNILQHINGGNIDVSKWSSDIGEFIPSVLKNVDIEGISLFDNSIVIFVNDEVFASLNEQSKLRLKALNHFFTEKVILTTEELYEKSNEKYTQYFMKELQLDEESAKIIANSGILRSVDDFIELEPESISEILDIDIEDVNWLVEKAEQSINERNTKLALENTNLKDLQSLKKHHLKMLLDKGVNTIPDLADFANDELCEEIIIDLEEANDIIMEARDIIYN